MKRKRIWSDTQSIVILHINYDYNYFESKSILIYVNVFVRSIQKDLNFKSNVIR